MKTPKNEMKNGFSLENVFSWLVRISCNLNAFRGKRRTIFPATMEKKEDEREKTESFSSLLLCVTITENAKMKIFRARNREKRRELRRWNGKREKACGFWIFFANIYISEKCASSVENEAVLKYILENVLIRASFKCCRNTLREKRERKSRNFKSRMKKREKAKEETESERHEKWFQKQ